MDKEYRILVTGIGGNVGQGILRNIRNTGINAYLVGTNVSGFSAGNHLVDRIYETPYAFLEGFVERMVDLVKIEKIQLIIPSTDFEAYYLSLHREKIPCLIAASHAKISGVYLDKYFTYQFHKENDIAFVDSCLPSEFRKGTWDRWIVKPRRGRGSRDLHFDPSNMESFSDSEYIVQEYIEGPEITTSFYVKKRNILHGSITMIRTLENGSTSSCDVTFDYDDQLIPIIQKMIAQEGLMGSVNIQSKISPKGKVIPFEINCRISGTNSIRSQLGFPDVKFLLQEHLLYVEPDQVNVIKGKAVRILMDVIFPGFDGDEQSITANTSHIIY